MLATLALALVVVTHARALQPGELVVVDIAAPAAADDVRVRAFDQDVSAFRLDAAHWRALVGIDLDVKPGAYALTATAGARGAEIDRARVELHVRAHRFPVRRLRVDEAFVNPPADAADRIAREARELEAIWQTRTPARLWTGAFVRPVPGPANSQFGTRSIFNGVPRNPHGGGDFLSPAGTPVRAPNAGRVVIAAPLYFSGNTVVIDHGLGCYSLLAHLSRIDVRTGQTVTAGEVVGLVGATGRVTGPHLHWAVRIAGARIDPVSVLSLLGDHADRP
jgi:murein DD-endopeptidase MepM/ murein hydrolase activator NlpD